MLSQFSFYSLLLLKFSVDFIIIDLTKSKDKLSRYLTIAVLVMLGIYDEGFIMKYRREAFEYLSFDNSIIGTYNFSYKDYDLISIAITSIMIAIVYNSIKNTKEFIIVNISRVLITSFLNL